ncbi:ankyrin repeat domain-containing protein 50-like [Planoprotostelium fungivorum]|uniref:Ankyrin repeat domain-containing protein 50-like n=2 Tax=Planoprotostelium fungivorum TaxID=1890364 RepID=A0A2P6MQ94_9EUKA|nr:ankyrin repeat domain-containing protein 50-like [Planoprotostelium fungivorum]
MNPVYRRLFIPASTFTKTRSVSFLLRRFNLLKECQQYGSCGDDDGRRQCDTCTLLGSVLLSFLLNHCYWLIRAHDGCSRFCLAAVTSRLYYNLVVTGEHESCACLEAERSSHFLSRWEPEHVTGTERCIVVIMEGDMLCGVNIGLDVVEMIMMLLVSTINRDHVCDDSEEHCMNRRRRLADWKSMRLVCRQWSLVAMRVLDYGFCDSWTLRMAAACGRSEVVRELLSLGSCEPSSRNNESLRIAVKRGDLEVTQLLLSDRRVDPSANNNECLHEAIQQGNTQIVTLLMRHTKIDPSCQDNDAIREASRYGHEEVVNALLSDSRVDPSARFSEAIRVAAELGHTNIVQRLLVHPRVNPATKYNGALRGAARQGHIQILKMLLEDDRVDAAAIDNESIRVAAANGHLCIVQALLSHPRVNPAARYNEAARLAEERGHLFVLRLLLADPRVDAGAKYDQPWRKTESRPLVRV